MNKNRERHIERKTVKQRIRAANFAQVWKN